MRVSDSRVLSYSEGPMKIDFDYSVLPIAGFFIAGFLIVGFLGEDSYIMRGFLYGGGGGFLYGVGGGGGILILGWVGGGGFLYWGGGGGGSYMGVLLHKKI